MKKIDTGKVLSIVDPSTLEVGEYLGKGASGYVQKAIYKPKNIPLALKVSILSTQLTFINNNNL